MKPCPFCGSRDVSVLGDREGCHTYVGCEKCFAQGPKTGIGEKEAMDAWDLRVDLPVEQDVGVAEPIAICDSCHQPMEHVLRDAYGECDIFICRKCGTQIGKSFDEYE